MWLLTAGDTVRISNSKSNLELTLSSPSTAINLSIYFTRLIVFKLQALWIPIELY